MMKKVRVQIPDEIATEILFLSDRTCCKCNVRGKKVQIHHVDDNPSNNLIKNLATLCFECHDETMVKGGFGRQLNSSQVIRYNEDWLERVNKRRDRADELASIESVTGISKSNDFRLEIEIEDFLEYKTNDNPELLKDYLTKISIIRNAELTIAQTKWDTGVTAIMNQGNSDIIDFYEEILVELASFYPKGHFNNQIPNHYFTQYIFSLFNWHSLILEPQGCGTGGTIVSTLAGGEVMNSLSNMIVEMVHGLTLYYSIDDDCYLKKWQEECYRDSF